MGFLIVSKLILILSVICLRSLFRVTAFGAIFLLTTAANFESSELEGRNLKTKWDVL